jgi:hypothetical protein
VAPRLPKDDRWRYPYGASIVVGVVAGAGQEVMKAKKGSDQWKYNVKDRTQLLDPNSGSGRYSSLVLLRT